MFSPDSLHKASIFFTGFGILYLLLCSAILNLYLSRFVLVDLGLIDRSVLLRFGLYRPLSAQIHVHQLPMDPVHPTNPPVEHEEAEWDTDGFVIPSLGIGNSDENRPSAPVIESSNSSARPKKEENIYLGPHGAPPSHPKQQELNPLSRKQRFKQKLKEADKKTSGGTARENKIDNLRELVGGGRESRIMAKGSPKEWLDPHCHESQFERR